MTARRFSASLERSDDGRGGHWVVVPFDGREAFGEARPPVAATLDGTPYRSRLVVYGGRTVLGITKAAIEEAGLAVGERLEVVLERDDAPRVLDVPSALRVALDADPAARAAFDELSFTNRREFAQWVADARREATRERRIARAIELLRAGARTPGG